MFILHDGIFEDHKIDEHQSINITTMFNPRQLTRIATRKFTHDVTHSVHRDVDNFKNEIVRTLDTHMKMTERIFNQHSIEVNNQLKAHIQATNNNQRMQLMIIVSLGGAGGAIAYAGYQELDKVKTDVADIKALIIAQDQRRWF
jgi:hypothetical protein